MICTSIEQSKHLLELGLDPKTADMVWMCNKWLYSIKDNILNQEQFSEQDTLAWSLSALLRVLPLGTELYKMRNDAHEIYYEIDCADATGWVGYEDSDPITAAYEMVCCLLEQGLIKKGGAGWGSHR